MSDMIEKEFEGQKIRTHLDENGEPWFVAQDVCEILDIKYQSHALRKLEDDQLGWRKLQGEIGIREFATVSESGLYMLVFRSDKPKAHKFRQWLSKDVIPSIRKTGTYSTRQMTPGEQLRQMADAVIANEKAVEAAVKELSVVKTSVVAVDKKVDTLGTTMNQLLMHRRGNDPVPKGTMPAKRIKQVYFRGVSEDIIREFLTEKNHPKVPFTFVTPNGAEISSFAWYEEGLTDLYEELIASSVFIKATPQKWMFSHPLIGNNFGFKKDELSPRHANMVAAKMSLDLAESFEPIGKM